MSVRRIRTRHFPQVHQKAELTCGQFNRTFSFALTKKLVRPRCVIALRTEFQQKFSGQRAMKSVEWKTYRTRFLVKAKQLNSSLSFTDHLGRQHCGRKGDYLVESCDGVLSITPRRIFEDIYVLMGLTPNPNPQRSDEKDEPASVSRDNLRLAGLPIEPLRIEQIKTSFHGDACGSVSLEKTAPTQRKTPQPVRVTSSRLGLM
jgi:hypothetical protein